MIRQGIYRHYKGDLYQVIGRARHTETLEELVVYKALYGEFALWVRPFVMFTQSVIYDSQEVPRFTFLQENEDNILDFPQESARL